MAKWQGRPQASQGLIGRLVVVAAQIKGAPIDSSFLSSLLICSATEGTGAFSDAMLPQINYLFLFLPRLFPVFPMSVPAPVSLYPLFPSVVLLPYWYLSLFPSLFLIHLLY